MEKYYTSERNVQIVLYLLKAYHIKKVIASPGTTNITLVASMQQDSYFEMYSAADERSAAYMACGLAAESGEPVVLSCTGATASRNYIPGLTEAFYRKLPVIAITSTQSITRVGQHIAQVIDRSVLPKDIALLSVLVESVKDKTDEHDCEIKVNKALSELSHHGGGPVHINLETTYNRDFSVRELPPARVINRVTDFKLFPEIPDNAKIGIFIGAHHKWTAYQTKAVDSFCALYNAVAFCDHTSGYKGKYRVLYSLIASQDCYHSPSGNLDLLIHIGEISGDYGTMSGLNAKEVWRVSEDGEMRDTFGTLRYVFECPEELFFDTYANKAGSTKQTETFLYAIQKEYKEMYNQIPELPFSNIWMAKKLAPTIPEHAILHLGILNSLRSWNFFEIPGTVLSYSNVGGFGIDGDVSTLVGASLANPDKLYFGILGDLAFFYDMNVLGNHHRGRNLRIMLINNGKGTEFRNYNHPGAMFGDDADRFIAAAGHYGNKSPELIKHYAEDLGFEYLHAASKEEFEKVRERFVDPNITERPVFLEVFTNNADESNALKTIRNIRKGPFAKQFVKKIVGEEGVRFIKKIIK